MTDRPAWTPMGRFTDLLPGVSGNAVNGLGEMQVRRPSPFFWHPADRHDFGPLQTEIIAYHANRRRWRRSSHLPSRVGRSRSHVLPSRPSERRRTGQKSVKAFALAYEGDLVGITPLDPLDVYEGYEIKHPTLIMIGVSTDYDELSQVPPSFENPSSAVEVARQYNRASRVCRELANFILAQGYEAETYPGPYAKQLNMIPAAIAAGLGQLGKHGSMINRTYGSSFRLSAVSTDMQLICNVPDEFGSEDFCTSCQLCVKECPPGAISDEKKMVRGVEKWYVDFDKCIPYFGEALACGICLAVCPWSRPGTGPKLAEKMLTRRAQKAGGVHE